MEADRSRDNRSDNSGMGKENVNSSQRTLFSEFETIDIAIKIIDLLEILHTNNIIHTNLNPENIFLLQGMSTKMCF
jgi:serine/threonine protein kinase